MFLQEDAEDIIDRTTSEHRMKHTLHSEATTEISRANHEEKVIGKSDTYITD